MAAPVATAVCCFLSEDQFHCPICLDVFTRPVTTRCGHNFCKRCLEQHCQRRLQCPVCKESFMRKPQLKTNTVLAEIVSQFKERAAGPQRSASVLEGDVPCDVCPEPRLKALKTCLLCLTSYCPEHLQPHVSNPRLKRHQLVQASPNLDGRICGQHDAPLLLFCHTDSKLICLHCFSDQHNTHNIVPLAVQCRANMEKLMEIIQERREKIKEIQNLVECSLRNANKEIQLGIEVFNALCECVQRGQDSFRKAVEEKHQQTESEAAKLIEKIRTEIEDLEQKRSKMETSTSDDHLGVLLNFSSIQDSLEDWTAITVSTEFHEVLAVCVAKLQNGEFLAECTRVFQGRVRLDSDALRVTESGDIREVNGGVFYQGDLPA